MYLYNNVILGVSVVKDRFFVKSGNKLKCGHKINSPVRKFCPECGKPATLVEHWAHTQEFIDWCNKSQISLDDAWIPTEVYSGQLAVFIVDPLYDIEYRLDANKLALGFCMYSCTGNDEHHKVNFDLLDNLHEYRVRLLRVMTELGLVGDIKLYPTLMTSY